MFANNHTLISPVYGVIQWKMCRRQYTNTLNFVSLNVLSLFNCWHLLSGYTHGHQIHTLGQWIERNSKWKPQFYIGNRCGRSTYMWIKTEIRVISVIKSCFIQEMRIFSYRKYGPIQLSMLFNSSVGIVVVGVDFCCFFFFHNLFSIHSVA